jgi:aryl-alcohol dehydrogenase-like predicted oxidoreductase
MDEAALAAKNKNISALQIEFNMLNFEAINKLFTLDEIKKLGIIAKIPFARGLLTEYGEQKTGMNNLSETEIENLKMQRNNLKKIVTNNERNLNQAALKFILAHKEMSTAIPGTKSIKHLEANIKSLSAPDLTDEELELIYKNG